MTDHLQDACEQILDSLRAGVIFVDRNHHVTMASQSCRPLFGIEPEMLDGSAHLASLLPDLIELIPVIDDVFVGGHPEALHLTLAGHRYFTAMFMPLAMPGVALPAQVIVSLRDVSSERAMENKLEALIESTPDPFIIVDAEGHIQRVNRQAEILFGYERQELLGRSFKILVPERFRAQHDVYTANYRLTPVMRQMGSGLEPACLTRSGEEIPVEIGLSPVVTVDETTIMVRFRDIRDHKREQALLHEALRKADEASRTKSRFLAAASHDLRQPLQSISMSLGVLAGDPDSSRRNHVIAQMRMSIETTNKLLNALLNITKLESGKVQPEIESFRIRDVLESVYNTEYPQALGKSQRFRLRASSLAVRSDPALLEQLITNLVANAVRYTPPRGHILLGCRRSGDHLKIEVSDTGPGIRADALDLIFDEYRQLEQTRQYQGVGLGLGLSIVKLLAELLQLRLEVRSTPGRGSCFSITVPLAVEAPKVRDAAPRAAPSRTQSTAGTVLLIDDDEAVLDSTSLFLGLSGYRVVVAKNSREALELLALDPPDLVITDYGLAQAETGLDLLEKIRAMLGKPQLPAIVITGDTSLQRRLGAPDQQTLVVCKPIDPEALLMLVRQRL